MKYLLFIIVSIVMSLMAVAQKKTPVKKIMKSISVPTEVNTAFDAKYTDVEKEKWIKKTNGNYLATFLTSEKIKQEVEFDAKGNYLRSRAIFPKDQAPEVVTTSLAKNHSDVEILEIIRHEVAGVSPYFKVKIKDVTKSKYLLISDAGDVSE